MKRLTLNDLKATLYDLKHDANTDWECEANYLIGIVDVLTLTHESDIRITRAEMEAYQRREIAKIRKEHEVEMAELLTQLAKSKGEEQE